MKCHEVDYEIIGDDMQVVEIELDPKETVVAVIDTGVSLEHVDLKNNIRFYLLN